jgi:alpha-galactosidase
MRDYVAWVRFLQGLGTAVLLCPWGDYFAYPGWLRDGEQRLPKAEKRDAMVRSLVDLVDHLRRTEGLDDVRYLCLMNEPDSDYVGRPTPVDEYLRLNRLLDRLLRERGLRQEVFLLGADECQSGPLELGPWLPAVLAEDTRWFDGLSVHTYRHEYTPALGPWFRAREDLLRSREGGRRRPILITESGYGGGTFDNPENGRYEYGLWMADFAVTALRAGAAAVLTWCLFDTYYTDTLAQHWGLWQYKDQAWEPRPGFYAWSLLTRYTRAGSRVVDVTVTPEAPSLRSVALLTPDGHLTVLLVNRYARPMSVTLQLGRNRALRRYAYSQETVPTRDHGLLPASGVVRSGEALTVPGESLVLLTEAP